MISQTAEYALRAVVFLAQNPERPFVAQEIATATKVPGGYLSKVLQNLVKAEIVRSQRGLHGGFELQRPATELRLLDVIQAVDPIRRIHTCPLKLGTHGANLCPLHRKLDNAAAALEETFAAVTLAELLSEPSASRPLCPFPLKIDAPRAPRAPK